MQQSHTLSLGRAIGRDGYVSDADLDSWVRDVVAPALESFTLTSATGYWRGQRETTAVVEYVGAPEAAAMLRALATDYKARFRQEAVALVSRDAAFELV